MKNAVVTLHEIKPEIQYKIVEQSGPLHEPNFVIEADLNGQTYRGEGR